MNVIKPGGHRLFQDDGDTAKVVSDMLAELERHGVDAVRRSSNQFDGWAPVSFELSPAEVVSVIASVPEQVVRDTDYCQDNVRRFARAQLGTPLPLEVEIRPGVVLGHRHIPVNAVGCYISPCLPRTPLVLDTTATERRFDIALPAP
jgi:sulfopropanediol 3-dehydrogenase